MSSVLLRPALALLALLLLSPPGLAAPLIVNEFNANQVQPSSEVGLHAQLVEYDMFESDGMNVGFNDIQTVPIGGTTTYKWYAGKIDLDSETGERTAVPVEYGAINLMASDPIKGSNKGLIGALIIEPKGATWADGSGMWMATAASRARSKRLRRLMLHLPSWCWMSGRVGS